jgi:hypothetical protein
MQTWGFKAAAGAAFFMIGASAAFLAGGMRMAAAEECAGPFRQCALSVNAQCSRDADGEQRMTYWDNGGKTIQFERCVGGVFEARGVPNPYKTGGAGTDDLPIPRTELLYPPVDW